MPEECPHEVPRSRVGDIEIPTLRSGFPPPKKIQKTQCGGFKLPGEQLIDDDLNEDQRSRLRKLHSLVLRHGGGAAESGYASIFQQMHDTERDFDSSSGDHFSHRIRRAIRSPPFRRSRIPSYSNIPSDVEESGLLDHALEEQLERSFLRDSDEELSDDLDNEDDDDIPLAGARGYRK